MIQSFDFRTLMEAKKLEPSLQLSALFEKPESVCKVTHNMGVRVASPRFSLVTPGMVEECHKLGVEVHPWTLNEESDWRKAVSMGVDGIITDYPRKLVSFLGLKESK